LITFTSSSWGGVFAFQGLINPYRLKARSQFPICVLSTKDRGDVNGNIDPVFKINSWSARENFTELLPAPTSPTASPAPRPAPSLKQKLAGLVEEHKLYDEQELAPLVDDDIPF
jgi:hypothetical protein